MLYCCIRYLTHRIYLMGLEEAGLNLPYRGSIWVSWASVGLEEAGLNLPYRGSSWVSWASVGLEEAGLQLPYRGMLACFFHGFTCFLLASTSRSLQILFRVVDGSMMSSTNPGHGHTVNSKQSWDYHDLDLNFIFKRDLASSIRWVSSSLLRCVYKDIFVVLEIVFKFFHQTLYSEDMTLVQ